MNKKDTILVLIILVIAGLLFLVTRRNVGGNEVVIILDGKEYGKYQLSDDREINVKSESGYNVVKIEDGKVYIKDADCPDKYCVKQGKSDSSNKSLICLPHKMVVEVRENDSENTDVDIIVQ